MNAGRIERSGGRRAAAAITLGVIAAAVVIAAIARGYPPAGAPAVAAAPAGTASEQRADEIVLDVGPAAVTSDFASSADRAALLDAANRLQQRHRFGEAEALLGGWLARSPADARVLLVRSQLRVHARNARGALADCMTAAAGLDALAASGCVAQARGALGDVRGARLLVESALARAADDDVADDATESWASGIAAELAVRDGDDVAADRWHRRAVELGGDAHYPPLAYADFLLDRGRRADALRLLAHAKATPEVLRRRARAEGRS